MKGRDDEAARLLCTATAASRPGKLSSLLDALEQDGVRIDDLEVLSLQGQSVAAFSASGVAAAVVEEAARTTGWDLRCRSAGEGVAEEESRWVVTVLSRAGGPEPLREVLERVEGEGGRILRVDRLAKERLSAWEIHLGLRSAPAALQTSLVELASSRPYDLAMQRESLFRRNKRLVVMDMDSTLLSIEVIDELARSHGVYEEVSEVTERAMRGELDFSRSLEERVALLAGLDVAAAEGLAEELPMSEGAEALVAGLRRLGYRLAVVSGGFTFAARALQRRLGLHHAHANELEVRDGRFTGRVVGKIIDAQRKAELLEEIARAEGLSRDQVVAVGDGANDLLMLQRAGLGIAFRAKPVLRSAAHGGISACGLDALLFVLGLSERELAELDAPSVEHAGTST